jgi:hypothetical protein
LWPRWGSWPRPRMLRKNILYRHLVFWQFEHCRSVSCALCHRSECVRLLKL